MTRTSDPADTSLALRELANSLIIEAFKMRASDIHLEPLPKRELPKRLRQGGE